MTAVVSGSDGLSLGSARVDLLFGPNECKLSKRTCCCVCFARFPPLQLYNAGSVAFYRLDDLEILTVDMLSVLEAMIAAPNTD